MKISAKLVFENYVPETLTEGMLFKKHMKDVIYGKIYEYDRVFEIDNALPLSPENFDSFIRMNGYPVRPMIMSITANPDESAVILAKSEEIGWFDEGFYSDELYDITIDIMNYVLSECDGEIYIDVEDYDIDDDDAVITAILAEGQVILSLEQVEPDYYDDEEDFDDMDDDSDEWPHDHPKDKTDYDPEDYETE